MPSLLFDAHLDLAWNALAFDRDQTLPVEAIRRREVAMPGKGRGRNTVSLPELRRGGTAVCLATVLARAKAGVTPAGPQHRIDLDYVNQDVAHAAACGQLAYYRLLESRGLMKMVRDRRTLDEVWTAWESERVQSPESRVQSWGEDQKGFAASSDSGPRTQDSGLPIGFILSMEGCDPIVEPAQAQFWWERGLRTASLAHYGPSAYAYGTGGDGPLTPAGRALLVEFARLGMILDLTHTSDTGFYQALDLFPGRVFASHNNCRALVPGDRQFSDDQVRRLIARDAVIGGVLDAWMLYPAGWKRGETPNTVVSLADVADHLDHVCQLAGNTRHAALGSDLDGGFGTEQTPHDFDTHADLHKLRPLLESRGYTGADLDAIFYGNWLRFFREALPL